jgi:TP901 family phage tail tape measure protein
MSEMRLKYFLDLVSNLGPKAQAEAKVVEDAQRRMEGAVSKTTDKVVTLERTISKIGQNSSTERQISYINRLGQAVDTAQQKMQRLRQSLAAGMEKAPEIVATAAGGYYGAKSVVMPPILAFSSLEAATQDLRIAMTDAKGNVSKDFQKISDEAVKLGNQLPGTTKDFMMAARALIEQGTPTNVVANGGLRAASYFGVLTGMDQYQSAETIAKMREAYGLKDEELVTMADLMQRGRYAFGINPMDYKQVASYAAPTYNMLGLTGVENAKKLMAVQGIAAQVGLESSSFGTNFSMMLQRIGQVDSRVNKNGKEAQEVRELLGSHGISMQFYNEKGQFSGIENMLAQLAKLQPLSQQDQQKILTKLFGVEAGRPAQILVQKGQQAYQEALAKIDSQASLDQRVTMKMDSFAAKLEALGGTIENVMAKIATQTGNSAKPLMDSANSALGSFGDFIDSNPTAGTGLLGVGGAAGAYLSGKFGGSILRFLMGGGGGAAAGTEGAVAGSSFLGGMALPALAVGGAGLTGWGIGSVLNDKVVAGTSFGDWVGMMGARTGAFFGSKGAQESLDATYRWEESQRQAALMANRRPGGAMPDWLTISAPGVADAAFVPGGKNEIKVGEGSLAIDVRVTDERVIATPTVTQPLSIVRINPGATNPGSFKR